jgi:hypothetical protein
MNNYKYNLQITRIYKDNFLLIDFLEEDFNLDIQRIIRYRVDKTRVATKDSGYDGEFIENVKSSETLENREKYFKCEEFELSYIESTKEEFEREWERIASQEGFYLKPYSEYTEEDWK